MKFIDFFSGIGGFRLGMEMAGHVCVGHCEIDKFANKSYIAMHSPKEDEWYADDIRRVSPRDLPKADVYCFGFPCQAFSIAGKRRGFEDTRGTLFFEVMRLAKERKPKILFAENVKGLLSHDKGRTFGTIARSMDELGYDVEWQVLNSKNFGVPQNRERVYIIGHLRGGSIGKIFPLRESDKETSKLQGQISGTITTRAAASQATGTYIIEDKQHAKVTCINTYNEKGKQRHQQDRIYDSEGVMTALSAQQHGRNYIASGVYIRDSEKFHKAPLPGPSRCLKANMHDAGVVIPVLTPERKNKCQNGRRFKEDGEPMFTLTSQDRHGIMIEKQIRALTPRECFRLQGFPDRYFDRARAVNSDSQLYKQAGNSVTVNVINEIAKRLK